MSGLRAKQYDDLPTSVILRFWKHMMSRHKAEWMHGKPKPEGARWHHLEDLGLVVSITTGKDFVRAFMRGGESAKQASVRARLEPVSDTLSVATGAPFMSGERDRFFISRLEINMLDEANWDVASDWLWERSQTYEAALRNALGSKV